MRIVFVLVASFLAVACGGRKSDSVHVDPALAMLVPSDTVFAAGIKMEPLRKAPIYAKALAGRQFPQIDEFAARTGVDPRKDLWELLIISDGKRNAVLARGKFTEGGLEPRFGGPDARRIPYKGYTLVGDERHVVTALNATTLAAGSIDYVRMIIDRRNQSDGIPAGLRDRIESIPPSYQIWAASIGGPQALATSLPTEGNWSNAGKLLALIQGATVGLELQYGVEGFIKADCANPEDTKRLHETARGLLGLARFATGRDKADLLQFYDTVIVNQKENSVEVRAAVPAELAEKLLN